MNRSPFSSHDAKQSIEKLWTLSMNGETEASMTIKPGGAKLGTEHVSGLHLRQLDVTHDDSDLAITKSSTSLAMAAWGSFMALNRPALIDA